MTVTVYELLYASTMKNMFNSSVDTVFISRKKISICTINNTATTPPWENTTYTMTHGLTRACLSLAFSISWIITMSRAISAWNSTLQPSIL